MGCSCRCAAAAFTIQCVFLWLMWVIEKATTPQANAVVSVAELQQFIAEHNRPVDLSATGDRIADPCATRSVALLREFLQEPIEKRRMIER
jgi:hypothetical protein